MNATQDLVHRGIENCRPLRRLRSPLWRGISSENDSSNADKIGTSSSDEFEGDKEIEDINGVLDGVVGDSIAFWSEYCPCRGEGMDIFILQYTSSTTFICTLLLLFGDIL